MEFSTALAEALAEATTKEEWLGILRTAIGSDYKVIGRESDTPKVTMEFDGQIVLQGGSVVIDLPYEVMTMASGSTNLVWRLESNDGSVWAQWPTPFRMTGTPASDKGLTIIKPLTIPAPVDLPIVNPGEFPLVQSGDIEFVGYFRVPNRSYDLFGGAGGYAMSYDPNGNGGLGSIFIAGNDQRQILTEISIPTPDGNPAHGINDFPVATRLQDFKDPSEGDYKNIYPSDKGSAYSMMGSLVKGNQLLTSWTVAYGASLDLTSSIILRNKNLSTLGHNGPLTFQTTGHRFSPLDNFGQKWYQGPMCHVPEAWVDRLGGDVLVGSSERSTTQRNSVGPAASSFYFADVGNVSPIPNNTLLGYYHASTSITSGPLGPLNIFHEACRVDGIAIAKNTRTLICSGSYGTASLTGFTFGTEACYGVGTSDPYYIGKPDWYEGVEHNFCYTPLSNNPNFHAYPYEYTFWMYDLLDLEKVKDGLLYPDQVIPYAKIVIPMGNNFNPDTRRLAACCVDNTSFTPRLFVAMTTVDQNDSPVIAVFNITTGQ